jgi:hypothetical protein
MRESKEALNKSSPSALLPSRQWKFVSTSLAAFQRGKPGKAQEADYSAS